MRREFDALVRALIDAVRKGKFAVVGRDDTYRGISKPADPIRTPDPIRFAFAVVYDDGQPPASDVFLPPLPEVSGLDFDKFVRGGDLDDPLPSGVLLAVRPDESAGWVYAWQGPLDVNYPQVRHLLTLLAGENRTPPDDVSGLAFAARAVRAIL